jgi:hypothetical protein
VRNSRRTVVLALSTYCRYCTASADFYKRLQVLANERAIAIVAVLPQPADEGKSYLERLGIPISVVKHASLDTLHVSATPTLMLVDSEGQITDSWVGRLPPSLEAEVISKISN